MAFGLPQISFIGYPLAVPCAGHAGLGFRALRAGDASGLVAHYSALDVSDRRMRFCATLNDGAVERHVARLWDRPSLVLAAFDGPLWAGPLHGAGPIVAVAELTIDGRSAELGLSVDTTLRRRGIGTYLLQTAAWLMAPRGVRRVTAYTLPGNHSFLALSRRVDGAIDVGPDEVEVSFDIGTLRRGYLRRRAGEALLRAA